MRREEKPSKATRGRSRWWPGGPEKVVYQGREEGISGRWKLCPEGWEQKRWDGETRREWRPQGSAAGKLWVTSGRGAGRERGLGGQLVGNHTLPCPAGAPGRERRERERWGGRGQWGPVLWKVTFDIAVF